jgi:hypothetical protein
VEWKRMFEILKKIGVKYKDRRIIYSLYKNQSAVVRNNEIQKESRIKKRVRQCCSLSALIFNTYIEETLNEVSEYMDVGVTSECEKVEILLFADDFVLAEDKEELKMFLIEMDRILKENYSMNVYRSKAKVMVCGKNVTDTLNMRLSSKEFKQWMYSAIWVTKSLRMVPVQRKQAAELHKQKDHSIKRKSFPLPINQIKN